jgi:hypothetical protein
MDRNEIVKLAIDENADAIVFENGEMRLVWWSEFQHLLMANAEIEPEFVMPLGENPYIDRIVVIDTLSTETDDE